MRPLLLAALLATAASAQDAPLLVLPDSAVVTRLAPLQTSRCAANDDMAIGLDDRSAPVPSLRLGDGLAPVTMPNWCGDTTAPLTVLPEGVRFSTPRPPFDGPDFDSLSDDALRREFGRDQFFESRGLLDPQGVARWLQTRPAPSLVAPPLVLPDRHL